MFFPHMGALPNTTLVTDPILITFEKHLELILGGLAIVPGHPRGLEPNKYGQVAPKCWE